MARTSVVDPQQQTRVPFLRGILTRSLQSAGLSFDDSYRIASSVREELGTAAEVTKDELLRQVVSHLEPFGEAVVDRYVHGAPVTPTIMVRSAGGQVEPYSRGQQRQELESCGLTPDEARHIAARVMDDLSDRGDAEIGSHELGYLTLEHLERDVGSNAAHSYLVWKEFTHSDRPLILLINGPVGAGKSTIATQVANTLGIVRIQSTDMLREVMRIMIPEPLLPVLHRSSFEAWRAMPSRQRPSPDEDALLEDGYLTQAELVALACGAIIQRAATERVSIILEGVHLHPSLVDRIPTDPDTIVVPLMLGVLNPKTLQKRLRGRERASPDRRAERYLKHFDDIWRLQTFLLSEADRAGVPIVSNDDRENTVREVISVVMDELAKSFSGLPEVAFR